MKEKTKTIMKGAAGGAAAGMLVSFLGGGMGSKKELKKKAEKALGTMSNIVDTVTYMFK